MTPGSKIEGITKENDTYLLKVKEPPKEGRANWAVIKLLSEYFGVRSGSVRIVSGHKSRSKVIEIPDDM